MSDLPSAPSSPPPPQPVATADLVLNDRYRLVRRVARGGMADVWEATDEVLARPVAVKLLHPDLAGDAGLVARFRQEARAAARLSHPQIVAVFDTCSEDGHEAIVMEMVRGETLRDLLDREGPLGAPRATHIAALTADALDHAHRSGLVHRDVKPGNILLADDGRVLVTDFGIAKATLDAPDAADLTDAGSVLGTAKYLAPEQVRSEPVDHRADIYALGLVLYEMLCGAPAFEADTAVATAALRLHDEPLLPRQHRASVPRELEALVLRAIARDPGDRPSSAADFATDLRALQLAELDDRTHAISTGLDTPPGTADAAPSFVQSERRWLVPAALILVVGGSLLVAFALLGSTDVGREIFGAARDAVTGSRRPASDTPPLVIADIRAFDPPPGDGWEHDDLLGNLLDGNQTTVWHTEGYASRDLGGLKAGVGFVLVLEAVTELERLQVDGGSTGWAAEIYVAEQPGTRLEDWGSPVAEARGAGTSHTFALRGVRGGALLVWITDLGDDEPRTRLSRVTLSR